MHGTCPTRCSRLDVALGTATRYSARRRLAGWRSVGSGSQSYLLRGSGAVVVVLSKILMFLQVVGLPVIVLLLVLL